MLHAMSSRFFVYILASRYRGTLYVGVTYDLPTRMEQHAKGEGSQFVKKYGVNRLVYFEEYPLYADAIRRHSPGPRFPRG